MRYVSERRLWMSCGTPNFVGLSVNRWILKIPSVRQPSGSTCRSEVDRNSVCPSTVGSSKSRLSVNCLVPRVGRRLIEIRSVRQPEFIRDLNGFSDNWMVSPIIGKDSPKIQSVLHPQIFRSSRRKPVGFSSMVGTVRQMYINSQIENVRGRVVVTCGSLRTVVGSVQGFFRLGKVFLQDPLYLERFLCLTLFLVPPSTGLLCRYAPAALLRVFSLVKAHSSLAKFPQNTSEEGFVQLTHVSR